LAKYDNEFKEYFNKQREQTDKIINIPSISISYKTSTGIKRFLNTIDIKQLDRRIKDDEEK